MVSRNDHIIEQATTATQWGNSTMVIPAPQRDAHKRGELSPAFLSSADYALLNTRILGLQSRDPVQGISTACSVTPLTEDKP